MPVVLDSACWARDPRQLRKQPQMIVDGHKDTPPEGSIAWAYYERFGAGLEKSVKDRLSSVGLVQDRLEVRGDGFPRLLISSQCRNLIRTLPALPRDDRNPEQVDTHAEDHCLTGDTLVHTAHGPRRIADLVGTQGWCAGSEGWVRYFDVRKTASMTDIVRVTFSDGTHLDCTPDHRLLTTNGWVEAGALSIGTTMHSATLWGWSPSSSQTPSSSTTASATTSAVATSNAKVCACTASSGKTTTRTRQSPSATDGTSTTSTMTEPTTNPPTCDSCLGTTTSATTAACPSVTSSWPLCERTCQCSKPAMPASPLSSAQKQPSVAGKNLLSGWIALARSAARSLRLRRGAVERGSVAAPAARPTDAAALESPNWVTSSTRSASSAKGTSLQKRGWPRVNASVDAFVRVLPHVVSVESRPAQDVYDLAVDDVSHAFAVNGGVVVHNCYDALSYLLQHFSRRYAEAVTTQERIRRGRGLREAAYGTVQSQTGDIAGGSSSLEW